MWRRVLILGLAVKLLTALPAVALAGDGSNVNHQAVWSLDDLPGHNWDSGSEWSDAVAEWSHTEHKTGVSCGVHDYMGVPFKDKCIPDES